MRIGKQSFLLEEVVLDNDEAAGWTGFALLSQLVEAVKRKKPGDLLKLEFASLTTFNRGSARNKTYSNYSARLPLPHYVFPFLAKRWQELAPAELVGSVQAERIPDHL
jgi:hypothetical protein